MLNYNTKKGKQKLFIILLFRDEFSLRQNILIKTYTLNKPIVMMSIQLFCIIV